MKLSAISGAMLAFFGMAAVHAQTYTFTDLGHASGVASAAASINNVGQVVGLAWKSYGSNQAVTWVDGQAIELGSASVNWGYDGFSNPWSMSGSAVSINDAGQIAWNSGDINNGTHATTLINGEVKYLGTLGGGQSEARGINQAGQIIGRAQNANGDWRAVVWNDGQATELATPAGLAYGQANAVNNVGQIVGLGAAQLHTGLPQPLTWSQGVVTNLDASLGNSYKPQAYGINDAGQIVGSVKAPNDVDYYRAVQWTHGVAAFLDMPAGFYAAEAKGINNAGQIVGFMLSRDDGIGFRAATWIDGQVVDLNSLLPAGAIEEGWVLIGANAINDLGQIVGEARNTKLGVVDAFVLTPVPESGTLAMMLLGLGAVAVGARRRAVDADKARG